MKYIYLFFLSVIVPMLGCSTQTKSPEKNIYNNEFKWKIKIPEDFENVSAEQWAKMQQRGTDAIENTYDMEVENNTKTIFVFKSDQLNYFESSHQPFDPVKDGDYSASCKAVNEVLYETFKTQMPNIKVDTVSLTETIDNLVFRVFKIDVTYPNQMVMYVLMYSRLFDKKELAVNIMFVDKKKGKLMLNAWRGSKFGK